MSLSVSGGCEKSFQLNKEKFKKMKHKAQLFFEIFLFWILQKSYTRLFLICVSIILFLLAMIVLLIAVLLLFIITFILLSIVGLSITILLLTCSCLIILMTFWERVNDEDAKRLIQMLLLYG